MATLYGANVVTDGLVLSLDAANPKSYPGSGTTWYDLNKRYDATLSSATFNSAGAESSFRFSGSGGAVTSGTGTDFAEAISIEIVYKSSITDTFSTYGRIFDRGDTTISLGSVISYQLRFWTYAGGSRSSVSSVNGIGQDGLWHHLMYIYNGTNTLLYLDGSFIVSYAKTGSLESGSTITIGNGDSNLFGGEIALCRVYNKGLLESEAISNFNATRGRFGI
jgi:hypothetical protein